MPTTSSNRPYVELNRTFHELSRYATESDDSDLSKAFYVGEPLSWDALVTEYRVVILAEAGSGKTEEIRHVAQRLRSEGKDGFFLRLENIPDHFDNAFDVGTSRDFDHWLSSGREGWLLLDSVDEARLRRPQDFELAIRLMADKLRLALDRTHIILTGRISAWRPKTDLDMCRRYLPYTPIARVADDEASAVQNFDGSESSDFDSLDGDQPERIPSTSSSVAPDENPAVPFRIVTLANLDRPRVEKFAQAVGVVNVVDFTKAIDKADGWQFTTRPQDLEDLIALWLSAGQIGGRLEIMQGGISRRLKEPDQNRDDSSPLSRDKADYGARLLAAATTLGRNPAIQVPDGIHNLQGIQVERVLPDWDTRERNAILYRPIFDAPAYGAVRFHHRTVREYLAADWLKQLLVHPTSRRAIEGMFFRTQYDTEIVVPTMRPVLPWMALFDERIRERVRRVSPEVLFEGGDPAKLPTDTRRQVLRDVTAEIATNYSPRSPTDLSAVQRFANVDLTEDVRSLLAQYRDNDDAVSFLLRLVWQGQLKGVLEETKLVAMSNDGGRYRRVAAIRALQEIGSPGDIAAARNALLSEEPPINREWVAEVVYDMGSSEPEIDWLIAVLAVVASPQRYHVDHLSEALDRFVARADILALAPLSVALQELLSRPPYVDGRFALVSKQNGWMLDVAAKVAERMILVRNTAALRQEVLWILHAIVAAHHFDPDIREAKTALAEAVPLWPELNRAVFWFEVEVARGAARGENRVTSPWQVSIFGRFWKFAPADLEYLCDQVAERPLIEDKLIALSLAYDAYVLSGRSKQSYDLLKRCAASGDTELQKRFQLLVNPPPRSELSPQEARWQKQAKVRERTEKANLRKSREYIREHLESVRDPNFPNPDDVSRTQWYLHHQTRDADGRGGKWTTGAWKSLIPTFGEDVALAYRDGAIKHWRRSTPKVRSEGAPANQTSASIIFGLTGLAIEARETDDWSANLSTLDVARACRYASHELNGFPEWFPSLFQAHPEVVANFLMNEVEFELAQDSSESMHYIIDDLSWSGQWAWPIVGPRVLQLLKTSDPRNPETLDKLLQMVAGSPVTDEELAALAKSKSSAGPESNRAQWFATWAGVAPEDAIPALDDYLLGVKDEAARTDIAMTFVTRLFGDRRSDYRISREAYKAPAHLKVLYQLMHLHIRPTDDIDRANGGVYSPTLRDHAQNARNAILNVLEATPGKEAYFAMKELAKTTQGESSRWIAYRAQRRAEQDGDLEAWTPDQVREFAENQDRTPSSHRELAELAVGRLLDLKDDLENGDSSIASILRNVTNEEEMRVFIGRELREKAAGRYSIPQEEELADAKRPDLRFHGSGIDAPVAVELKLADKWTGPQLLERLENQLSGSYLRDRRSMHGIYLLIHRGAKQSWDLPDGERVTFKELVAALAARWQELAPRFPAIDDLSIIGVDLTLR